MQVISSQAVTIARERDEARRGYRRLIGLLKEIRPHLARVPSVFEPKKGTRLWGPDDRRKLLDAVDAELAGK